MYRSASRSRTGAYRGRANGLSLMGGLLEARELGPLPAGDKSPGPARVPGHRGVAGPAPDRRHPGRGKAKASPPSYSSRTMFSSKTARPSSTGRDTAWPWYSRDHVFLRFGWDADSLAEEIVSQYYGPSEPLRRGGTGGTGKAGDGTMTLTLKDVTKRFKKRVAVDRFSMEFQPGVYGLLGPNGAGKTTPAPVHLRAVPAKRRLHPGRGEPRLPAPELRHVPGAHPYPDDGVPGHPERAAQRGAARGDPAGCWTW